MELQVIVKKDGSSETECQVAVLSLGLCMALENKALTIRQAELLLFSPDTMSVLEDSGASSELIGMVHLGSELEDVERHFPETFQDALGDIKSVALSVMRSLPETWQPEEGWFTHPDDLPGVGTNGHILLVGVKDTAAVMADLESRDIVEACEASGHALRVMVYPRIDLTDQDYTGWLKRFIGRVLADHNETGVDIQIFATPQPP